MSGLTGKLAQAAGPGIAGRLTLSVAALAGIAIVGAGATGLSGAIGLGAASDALRDSAAETSNVQVLAEAVKSAELDVVQVQQFLTDLSATRGLNGLDDGGEEAAKNAAEFNKDIEAAIAAAEKLGAKDMIATLEASKEAFPAYYSVGKRMAAAYVARGPEGGNVLMPEFDAAAEKIHTAIDSSLQALVGIEAAAQKRREGVIDEAESARSIGLTIAGLVLLAAAGIGLVVVRYVRGRVGEPLHRSADAITALARGDETVTLDGAERDDEVGQIARAFATLSDNDRIRRDLAARQAESEQALAARERKVKAVFEAFEARLATIESGLAASMSAADNAAGALARSADAGRARAGSRPRSRRRVGKRRDGGDRDGAIVGRDR